VPKKVVEPPRVAFTVGAILIAIVIWALSFPMLIWVLGDVQPLTLAMLRSVILIIPLLVYLHLTCGLKKSIRALRDDTLLFVLLGLTTVAIPNISQNLGMVLNKSSSISGILQSSGPIYTVILAVLLLHERMGARQYFGLAFGLLGSILLATNGFQSFSGGTFLGNMLVIVSAVSYSFSSILGKKALAAHKPPMIIAWSLILGGLMTVPPALTERFAFPPGNAWLIIIGLAILPSFLAYIMWYGVMEYTPVSRLTISIYLVPVLTIIFSYLLLNEMLSPLSALFAAMIIAGVIVANVPGKGDKRKSPKNSGKRKPPGNAG
jgi:drug/metabolite transporter (DMT)-like permease